MFIVYKRQKFNKTVDKRNVSIVIDKKIPIDIFLTEWKNSPDRESNTRTLAYFVNSLSNELHGLTHFILDNKFNSDNHFWQKHMVCNVGSLTECSTGSNWLVKLYELGFSQTSEKELNVFLLCWKDINT